MGSSFLQVDFREPIQLNLNAVVLRRRRLLCNASSACRIRNGRTILHCRCFLAYSSYVTLNHFVCLFDAVLMRSGHDALPCHFRGLRVSRRNAAVWIYRIGVNDLNMLSLDGLRENKLVLHAC